MENSLPQNRKTIIMNMASDRRSQPCCPQRIIKGQGGEIYYSPDHYKTFIKIEK